MFGRRRKWTINKTATSLVTTLPNVDKWRLVQISFFLQGIAALLPWNMLINADSYFVDYKLIPLNGSLSSDDSETLTNYRHNFLPYLSTASKLPNIIFQIVNLLFSSQYLASSNRLLLSYMIEILLFLITIVLIFVDTSSWTIGFFWTTIIIAILFNTANGFHQNCLYGIGAKFPSRFINAITLGFSFSGTIASVFMIVSLTLSPAPETVALLYFSFATLFMLTCATIERYLRCNRFVKYCITKHESAESSYVYDNPITVIPADYDKNHNVELENTRIQESRQTIVKNSGFTAQESQQAKKEITSPESAKARFFTKYWNILQQSWIQLLNIILVYFVSFSIFPAIQVAIRPQNNLISDKYFTPIFCFLFFNTWAGIGNILAEYSYRPSPKTLIYWCFLRAIFLPLFVCCNYLPGERQLPVLFNDYGFILLVIIFSLSSGYLSALALMYAPETVETRLSSDASMMASASVIVGILAGVQHSIVLRHFTISTDWFT